eukprot:TRINITY_DN8743_c0_g1_i2.p1 TRINITY_DN8743_c0_g1~~TRINITY_DN8743_c0_g1_i2.p1  ORF type:complete len:860 (-),score=111.14 TRINITY_DN8743_c0_g1_i2:25-2604(-)
MALEKNAFETEVSMLPLRKRFCASLCHKAGLSPPCFADASTENAYVEFLNRKQARALAVVATLVCLLLILELVTFYLDNPNLEQLPPVKVIYLVLHCLGVVICFAVDLELFSYLRLHTRLGLVRLLGVEGTVFFFAGAVALLTWLYSKWHLATFFGHNAEVVWESNIVLAGESSVCILQIIIVLIMTVFIPIRASSIRWHLLLTFSYYIVVSTVVGSPFPDNSVWLGQTLALCLFCSYKGCRIHDVFRREKWLQHHELVEAHKFSQAMQLIAGTQCDLVFKVSKDGKVLGEDKIRDAFFNQSTLAGLQAVTLFEEVNRTRFLELFHSACTQPMEPYGMPASLCLEGYASHQRQNEVQLVLLGTGCKDCSVLVGIRSDYDKQACSSKEDCEFPLDADDMVERDFDLFEKRLAAAGTDTADATACTKGTASKSVFSSHTMSTGCTEKIFGNFANILKRNNNFDERLLRQLELVANLGVKEHWLIPSTDLRLSPHDLLGIGSFGIVVAAELYGIRVAVKVARSKSKKMFANALPGIARELRVLRYVRHPGVALFYGACVDLDTTEIALISELVAGQTLKMFVEEGNPSAEVRLKLLTDVSSVLNWMHSQATPIIHGDVKDTNVMVEVQAETGHSQAKLLDFGLSAIHGPDGARPQGGSMRWQAPEVWRPSSPASGSKADVFSFGRLVFFVTTGRQPLKSLLQTLRFDEFIAAVETDTLAGMRWNVKDASVGAVQDLDLNRVIEEARVLCEACVRLSPYERPTTLQIMKYLEVLRRTKHNEETCGQRVARREKLKNFLNEPGSDSSADDFDEPSFSTLVEAARIVAKTRGHLGATAEKGGRPGHGGGGEVPKPPCVLGTRQQL